MIMNLCGRILITLSLFGLCACGATIDIPISEESSATIEGATVLETLVSDFGFGGFVTFDVTANQELQNQGVTREQIAEIKVTRINLTVVDPASQDLSFLSSLEFYVEADGFEKKKIAELKEFPDGEGSLDLELFDVDLAPYATAPSMDITTDAEGNRPPEDTTIEATLDMTVKADLGGIINSL